MRTRCPIDGKYCDSLDAMEAAIEGWKASSLKWKRAAEWLARRINDCQMDIDTNADCAAYWLGRALAESEMKP